MRTLKKIVQYCIAVCLSLSAGAGAGCAFQPEGCQRGDCPSGTTCRSPEPGLPAMCLVSPAPGPDSSTPDAAVDLDPPDDARVPDMRRPDLSFPDAGECLVSDTCGFAEPNDTEDTAVFLSTFAGGCPRFDFEPVEREFFDTLCAGDRDVYELQWHRCADVSFRVRVELEPAAGCASRARLALLESPFSCDDDDTICETDANGVQSVTAIIRAGNDFMLPAERLLVAVETTNRGLGMDYEIRANVVR